MAQQTIAIGAAANDGTGDTWRDAMDKSNDNFTELYGLTASGSRVIVSTKDDLPAPATGVITLLAGTQYFFVEDVSIDTDRLVLLEGTSISGIDNINITISYTGTGNMITGADNTMRVEKVTLSAPSGTLFDWSETTGKVMRVNDVGYSCANIATFSGVNGVIRFTNVSGTATASGCTFTGNYRSFLWEVSAATMDAGAHFALGSATFDSFIATNILSTLNGSSNLISGAAASANINTGGQGSVLTVLSFGAGTPLSTVSQDDARWKMFHNNLIPNTSRTATGYILGNAVATSIATISTPVKVNFGTGWIAGKQSQWSSDNTGTHTYTGPDESFHVTGSINAQNVTGNAKVFRWYLAVNGTIDLSSVSQREYSSSLAGTVPITAVVDVVSGDTVELYVENITDTTNITAITTNLVIEG